MVVGELWAVGFECFWTAKDEDPRLMTRVCGPLIKGPAWEISPLDVSSGLWDKCVFMRSNL